MMGFNPTFYAGRPKLSEVTIDSDLDMGGRGILRVGRIDTPYMPETWPTEELDWGDVPAGEKIHLPSTEFLYAQSTTVTPIFAFTTPNVSDEFIEYEIRIVTNGGYENKGVNVVVKDGETTIHTESSLPWVGVTTFTVRLPPNKSIIVGLYNTPNAVYITTDSYYQNTGVVGGAKTFDLTGKWLALGIDMHGLAATVKIQGVEMPYSDYAKYFPLAPTELKIPGGWDDSQIRPIVEVYV